ncbi:S-formylglutathione hydrolase FrmB [Amycolatopsis arida]|uniref:S-formylglutathione hydrolase FrmB n=1 Tax=Amycolatopsis arida TaxID=587909 RepID=A0A1I5KV64_9PSEU|nr:alpha/beta hydrolase family protein [Amycolatopsis arida]TDX85850.1 S-formylglutathione hydrolase FrmB [Amycolatopsis arida]SFO88853.1 S-formylglutathione hydrolase FrmB [Amycolatopsis arida]
MGGLRVLASAGTGANVRELRLFSPALGREAEVVLLVPDGPPPHPVLYLLHGSSDDHRSWLAHTDVAARAAGSGVLVVLPEAGRLGFYTDWRVPDRRGTVPRWETFHLVELRELVEREFGAGGARMVAGLSMGGYGALRYAMRHPGMFRAAASLSGLMHLTRPGMAALLGALSLREGMRPGRVWGPRRTCRDEWAANDPYLCAESLRGTRVYLAAGDGRRVPGEERVPGMGLVERYSRAMSEDLATRLRELGGDVTTRFGPGTHFWTTWRRMVTELWPYALDVLRE